LPLIFVNFTTASPQWNERLGYLQYAVECVVSLSARLTSYFDRKIRERGEQVYQDHLVTINHGSAVEVKAEVQGSYLYEAELIWKEEESALDGWCGCPYFDDQGACKHLWATILAAEAKGYLSAAASDDQMVFLEDYRDDDAETYRSSKSLADSRKVSSGITKPPAPEPPTAWRQKLTAIASEQYLCLGSQ
jgi:uncharacterized Zn finger protein